MSCGNFVGLIVKEGMRIFVPSDSAKRKLHIIFVIFDWLHILIYYNLFSYLEFNFDKRRFVNFIRKFSKIQKL